MNNYLLKHVPSNFALTVRYRNALGLSKFFTGVMIAASISWIVCCLSYIPYDVSVTDLSTFTGDNGQQVLRFLNFLNDVTFIGSFMLYQFCTIYEFGYVAGFAPVGKISQKVLACLATVVYSCGFFWLHPWIDWCYWTTCEIMPILNQDVYVYYDTTAELVYSFIDIFLGIMVFYVVSKINPKPSNSHKYFELKSRTLKFSVSWSLIALGSYILMIISLCIPPANSDSFVDFPAIFHDSSRIMVSLEVSTVLSEHCY